MYIYITYFCGAQSLLTRDSAFQLLLVHIRESVDSLCRDGADTSIVCIHVHVH